MNIIKWTLYFPGFVLCHVLVACCLMMARWAVESMMHGYHQYISKIITWKWTKALKILQYWYPYLNPYAKLLKHISCCCSMCLKLQKGIWQKKLANCCDLQNSPKFFPLQSFYCTAFTISVCIHILTLISCLTICFSFEFLWASFTWWWYWVGWLIMSYVSKTFCDLTIIL